MIPKTFLSADGHSDIHVAVWPVENPKAILQITHGMAEYIERYDGLAKYLNQYGILVAGHDHIGHGQSSLHEDYGYFGEEDGWRIFAEDVEKMYRIIKEEYPGVPHFVLGHSMGSFVARTWFAKFAKDVDGVIFEGTAGSNPALKPAFALISLLIKTKGSRYRSKTITGMAFGSYNSRIKDAKSHNAWLSRDEEVAKVYDQDPACGFMFTLAGYNDLFSLLTYINSSEWYNNVPKDVPVLLMAGCEDPVGDYGKGPAEVAEKMEEAGCSNVSLLLYEGMRHELHNEIGKETVMNDIKRFILDEAAEEELDDAEASDK